MRATYPPCLLRRPPAREAHPGRIPGLPKRSDRRAVFDNRPAGWPTLRLPCADVWPPGSLHPGAPGAWDPRLAPYRNAPNALGPLAPAPGHAGDRDQARRQTMRRPHRLIGLTVVIRFKGLLNPFAPQRQLW